MHKKRSRKGGIEYRKDHGFFVGTYFSVTGEGTCF